MVAIKKNNDKASVGAYIVTHCSKCNNNVNHVVVAQDGTGTVARVKCIVCSSEHKYKTERSSKIIKTIKRSGLSSGRSASAYTKSNVNLWEQSKLQASNKVPLQYKTSDLFEKNMLIFHTKLGEGVVLKTLENKIEVIFKDGIKLLVHGLK